METFDDIQHEALNSSELEFAQAHPHPALLVFAPLGQEAAAQEDPTLGGGTDWLTKTEDWLSKTYEDVPMPQEGLDLPRAVAWVVKRTGGANPFANLITLGRMSSNDVEFPYTMVSKVHAAILLDPPLPDGTRLYGLRDQNSTNGTFVSGQKLSSSERTQLQDGAFLALGSLRLRFMLCATLWRYARDPRSFA